MSELLNVLREHLAKRARRRKANRLVLAANGHCPCGWVLAYDPKDPEVKNGNGCWDCAGILLGVAPYTVTHTDRLPFRFWNVRPQRDGRRVFRVRP